METIEQGLRRIFKNAPHIYAECVRCAKERPHINWEGTHKDVVSGSHEWSIDLFKDESYRYWDKLNNKANAGEEIGPDYPLPPDSPIRQKEVGNWYMCVNGYKNNFITKGWYKCIKPTNKLNSFIDNKGERNGWRRFNHEHFDLSNPLPHNPETKPTLEDIEQAHQSLKTDTSGSNFIIKVDDGFCEWEYGFTAKKACIDDFICAIEETLSIKRDYEKMLRGVDTKPTIQDMEPKPEQAPEPTQKTEIKLHEERFTFSRNYCTVVLQVFYTQNNYKVYQPKIDDVDQDNHETLLELQLEAVRFAKKRLLESSGNYSNN